MAFTEVRETQQISLERKGSSFRQCFYDGANFGMYLCRLH